MRASFTFKLPDEQEEYEMMSKAGHTSRVIEELDDYLRQRIKYAPETQSEAETEIYQAIRSKLWELKNNE